MWSLINSSPLIDWNYNIQTGEQILGITWLLSSGIIKSSNWKPSLLCYIKIRPKTIKYYFEFVLYETVLQKGNKGCFRRNFVSATRGEKWTLFAFLWHGKNINPIPQLKINSPSPFWSILLFGVLQKLNTLPLDWLTWEMVPQSNPASAIA